MKGLFAPSLARGPFTAACRFAFWNVRRTTGRLRLRVEANLSANHWRTLPQPDEPISEAVESRAPRQ
jgi:hypothetical protein